MKNLLSGFIVLIVLSASSFAQNIPSYVPVNGLMGWWPFEGNGNDATAQGNNATNFGAVFTQDRFGNPASAVSFDGFSSYLQVATPSFSLSETGQFTYSVWVKKQVQSTSGVVVMSGNNTTGNFISNVQGMNEIQFGANKQQSAWIWLTCPHTLFVWEHIVATYNAGIMKLYKNGIYQSSTSFTYTGTISAVQPLWFGRGPGGNHYTGDADDVGIWNRELTPSEIIDLYTGCEPLIASHPSNQSCNLLGIVRFIVAGTQPAASFQWQTNQGGVFQNVPNSGQYTGAGNDTLIVSNATMANNNQAFRCILTLGNCSDTSTTAVMTVNNTVGTDPQGESLLPEVFPNPAGNQVFVGLPAELTGRQYYLSDAQGRCLFTGTVDQEVIRIDLSTLGSGLYFFTLPGLYVKKVLHLQPDSPGWRNR